MELKPFGEKAYAFIMNPIEGDARINILEGSVRSSKTFSMIPKLLGLVHHGPKGGLPIITGVSKETIHDNILRDVFDIAGKDAYSYNRQSGELNLFGRVIKVIGAKDEGSEKYIRGMTVPWAYADEVTQIPESFFHQLLNRMSIKDARLYCTTNPRAPTHYLYKDFIADPIKIASGMVKVWHFTLEDNPNIDDEYKDFIRKAHAGVFYLRDVLGLWVQAEGAIYKDCWSDDLIYKDEDIPYGLYDEGTCDQWIANDYGTDHPHVYLRTLDDGVTLWIAQEYVWDSRKEGRQKTDGQYADDLEEFMKAVPERKLPSAEGCEVIIPPEAASFKAECRTRGIRVTDADNEVLDGIRTVSSMMALRRIRIHESCTQLLEGIKNHVWDDKASKRGVEQPLKQNDDLADAFRYTIKTKVKPWRLAV